MITETEKKHRSRTASPTVIEWSPVSDAGPLSARQGALLLSRGLGGSREQDAGAVDLYLLSQRTGHKDLKFMQSGEGFRVAKRYDGHTKNYTYEASPS